MVGYGLKASPNETSRQKTAAKSLTRVSSKVIVLTGGADGIGHECASAYGTRELPWLWLTGTARGRAGRRRIGVGLYNVDELLAVKSNSPQHASRPRFRLMLSICGLGGSWNPDRNPSQRRDGMLACET